MDARDWEAAVEENADRMYSVALRIVGNPQDAEDAVQDAFLNAFRGLAHFRHESLLSTWLHRITVNAALAKVRKKDCARLPYEEALTVAAPEGWQERCETLSVEEIEDALQCVPVHYRTAIILRDVECLSTAETARILGVPEATAKTRLHKGRVILRTRLLQITGAA